MLASFGRRFHPGWPTLTPSCGTQVRGRYQLDASATYHLNESFAVFVEGVNLTNRPILKYAYYENQFLYAEDSGRRYKIGVRAQF